MRDIHIRHNRCIVTMLCMQHANSEIDNRRQYELSRCEDLHQISIGAVYFTPERSIRIQI